MSPKRVLWWLGIRFFDIIEKGMVYIHVKPFRQSSDFCGPTSVRMRLHHLGITASEEEIARLAGATKSVGASASGLIKAAEHYGRKAFAKEDSTLNDLLYYLKKGIPVIVDWFWEDDGHYSLVVGMDKKYIYLRDPSFWRIRKMPFHIFDDRLWHDFPGKRIERSNMILRLMIVIE